MSTSGRCWLCDADVVEATLVDPHENEIVMATLSPSAHDKNPYAPMALPPVDIDDSSAAVVQSVALVGGLILVLAVLFAIAPGLAVCLAVVTAPALLRTVIVVARRKRSGTVVSLGEQSVLFFASVAGVISAVVAAAGAFFIACSAVCLGAITTNNNLNNSRFESTLQLIGLGSVLFGLAVLYSMWRRRK